MTQPNKPFIILIEPDTATASTIAKSLRNDFSINTVQTAEEALNLADANTPDAVITDIVLSGHSGTEFLYEFRSYVDWQNVPVIVFSSLQLSESALSTRDWKLLNIAKYLYKPQSSISDLRIILLQQLEGIEVN